jgi:hypothetical protein
MYNFCEECINTQCNIRRMEHEPCYILSPNGMLVSCFLFISTVTY